MIISGTYLTSCAVTVTADFKEKAAVITFHIRGNPTRRVLNFREIDAFIEYVSNNISFGADDFDWRFEFSNLSDRKKFIEDVRAVQRLLEESA